MKLKRYGILNDIHFPYEDRARYRVALKIFRSLNIDGLYLNGDIGEFQGVSSWPMHPGEKTDFCTELKYINKKFDELMELFPDLPVTYICGNHEYRFFRYIRDLAPQMWGLTDCPKLLEFERRPLWRFVDYGPDQLVRCGKSDLFLRHEPLVGGKHHARGTAENSVCDLAYGHTHTYQTASHKKFGAGKRIINTAYSLGYLGDKTRHVFDYRGPRDVWISGCTVVETDETSGAYSLEFVCLDKLPVLFRGKNYDAK